MKIILDKLIVPSEEKIHQEWSGKVCQNASKELSDILLDNDIQQRLKQWEEYIRDWLKLTLDWEDITIELLESKHEVREFSFPFESLKGFSLREIKRRIELAANLEEYGINVSYRDFWDLWDLEWTEKLKKWLEENQEKSLSFRTEWVTGVHLYVRGHK
jgi:hypothetical protein